MPASPADGQAAGPSTWSRASSAVCRWRIGRLGRYLRGLDHVGLVFGLLAFLCSLSPSLLPRPWPGQGLVSGLGAGAAYAIGVLGTRVGRWAGVPSPAPTTDRGIRYAIVAFGVLAVAVMLWLSAGWQNQVRRAVDMPTQGRYLHLGILAVAAVVFAALIGLARAFRDLYRVVLRRLRRFVPVPAARLTAAVVVTALAVTLLNGALYHALLHAADSTFSSVDRRTDPPATPPLRSGGPGSLVSWSSLGREGRDFVSAGPTVSDIERLTGRPAVASIRAFAGRRSAPTLRRQAELVPAELKRTNAFDRTLLAVATTTGNRLGGPDPGQPP